jgi:transposase
MERETLETKEILSYVDKLEDEIVKLNNSNAVPKRFSDYFIFDDQPQKTLSYKRDNAKIDERISRAGFFILITENAELKPEQIKKMYKEKNVIEHNFHQLKNDIDFKRLRTHLNKTTEGKVFVGFLALIVRSYMLQLLKKNPLTEKMTYEKIRIELGKIESVIYSDGSEEFIPLTKKQKDILSVLGIKNIELK